MASGQIAEPLVSDMNNLYVISKEDPIKSTDKAGHEIESIDDPPPLVFDESNGKKRIEHRCHKRFQLNENAFALIRPVSAGPIRIYGKSMGAVACAVFDARPSKLGKIDNISMGGLMFHYVDSMTQLSEPFVLDILLADCGFYLANMAYKTVADVLIPEELPGDPFAMRQVRLQFKKLNAIQHAKLHDFILNHGAENGDLSVTV
jgi:hypothetical protein